MNGQAVDYWLQRLGEAVDKAAAAPSRECRAAYLDLARHYWSMHVMVNGQHETRQFAIPELIDAASGRPSMQLRRAA